MEEMALPTVLLALHMNYNDTWGVEEAVVGCAPEEVMSSKRVSVESDVGQTQV